MLRAAAKIESAGIPTVSLVCHGFEGLANATARGVGQVGLVLAVLDGHVDTQTSEEMLAALLGSTFEQIENGLRQSKHTAREAGPTSDVPGESAAGAETLGTTAQRRTDQRRTKQERTAAAEATSREAQREIAGAPVAEVEEALEHDPTEIVFSGTLASINDAFIARQWSDGAPFMPPTLSAIRCFLHDGGPEGFSEDDWHRSLGTMKPSGQVCTPWSVAVNAVMVGCESRQLPVLLALAHILLDPAYGVEHSGNTTGADALIIVSGANAADLGFVNGQGALREGVRANTTVGRWLRLFLRNICGFVSGSHDKATFGNAARVVFVEDHVVLQDIGWAGAGHDLGCAVEELSVCLARFNSGVLIGSVVGSTPEEILPYLADGLVRVSSWELTHVYGIGQGHYRPLLILSPMLANIFGDAGWSKDDVRSALFDQARMSAEDFERYIGAWSNLTAGHRTLQDLVAFRKVPKVFARSADPRRLVPIVTEPRKFLIAVGGDPDRANAYAMSNDGPHGYPTARSVLR